MVLVRYRFRGITGGRTHAFHELINLSCLTGLVPVTHSDWPQVVNRIGHQETAEKSEKKESEKKKMQMSLIRVGRLGCQSAPMQEGVLCARSPRNRNVTRLADENPQTHKRWYPPTGTPHQLCEQDA